jgi:hypothetical protein
VDAEGLLERERRGDRSLKNGDKEMRPGDSREEKRVETLLCPLSLTTVSFLLDSF